MDKLLNLFTFKLLIFFFFLRFCLFIWQREQESASQESSRGRGRSRLPVDLGAPCGAPSQDLGIMTLAKGRHLTDWATQVPPPHYLLKKIFVTNYIHPLEHWETIQPLMVGSTDLLSGTVVLCGTRWLGLWSNHQDRLDFSLSSSTQASILLVI